MTFLNCESKDVSIMATILIINRDGLELLCQMQADQRPSKVIIMTAFHDMQTMIWAMKNGAYDYIRKSWDNDTIERVDDRFIAPF